MGYGTSVGRSTLLCGVFIPENARPTNSLIVSVAKGPDGFHRTREKIMPMQSWIDLWRDAFAREELLIKQVMRFQGNLLSQAVSSCWLLVLAGDSPR